MALFPFLGISPFKPELRADPEILERGGWKPYFWEVGEGGGICSPKMVIFLQCCLYKMLPKLLIKEGDRAGELENWRLS